MILLQWVFFLMGATIVLASCGSHPKDKERLLPTKGNGGRGGSPSAPSPHDPRDPGEASQKAPENGITLEGTNDKRLLGTWQSERFEPQGDKSLPTMVTFEFDPDIVTTHVIVFDGKDPMAKLRLVSAYEAGALSSLGQDVRLIDYTLDKAFLTFMTEGEAMTQSLNQLCGIDDWVPGEEVEITALPQDQRDKCDDQGQVEAGDQLFDIYRIEDHALRFGLVPGLEGGSEAGLSNDKRPGELNDLTYTKVSD